MKEFLEDARDIIEEPSAWVQGYRALDKYGNTTDAAGADAIQFCAEGAMVRACRSLSIGASVDVWRISKSPIYRKCIAALDSVVDCDITIFNDDPATTHEDILRVFDRAIAKAWE